MSQNTPPRGQLTREAARQHVLDAIQETVGILYDPRFADILDGGDRDVTFIELEFDSLSAMEFCLQIDDTIGIEVEPADLVLYPSINTLAEHLMAKSAAR